MYFENEFETMDATPEAADFSDYEDIMAVVGMDNPGADEAGGNDWSVYY